jgi:hypothetical protein
MTDPYDRILGYLDRTIITYSWKKNKGIWFEGTEIAIFSFLFTGETF